jgi:cytochrome c-type biogenesis protein CcmI
MTLWFGLALMTAAAIWAVLWPLARRASQLRSGSDVAIYRDQLEEIERDRAAGLIEDNEAVSAQVEVSRRLRRRGGAGRSPSSRLSCCRSAQRHFISRSVRLRFRTGRSPRVLPLPAPISRSIL